MGRTGLWSSAAAGVSLVAAALILVAGVSTLIAFRGFRGVQAVPSSQSVVVSSSSGRETGAAPSPTPGAVVIAAPHRSATVRDRRDGSAAPARRAAATRSRVAKRPARSGLSAPAERQRPAAPASPSPAPAPAPTQPPTRTPAPSPLDQVAGDVAEVVEDATPGEKVGEVLLDLRDLLP